MAKVLKSSLPYEGPHTENLIEFIRDGLRRNAKETIVVDSKTGLRWTGKDLESVVFSVANFLIKECNLQKGDVCSLYGEERDWVTILILSVICAGGVSNYLTNKSSGREVHDTAKVLGSKFLISTNEFLSKIKPDLTDIQADLQVISCDKSCDGFTKGCKSIESILFDRSQVARGNFDDILNIVKIKPDEDIAVIQFSSGTTGKPKPIPRTHKNLCHLVASVDHEELMNLKAGVVIAGSLPISHRPGLWALLASVNGGSTFVVWSNLSDVDDALATVEKYKVNIFSSSLPFLSMLGNTGIKLKEKYDTSSLRQIITSGAKIVNPDLPKRLVQEFGLSSLRQCFGMTESGWVFLIEETLGKKDHHLSVGHVVPGMEAVVLDREKGTPLETHGRGEIAVRGPQVFPGYLTDKPGVLNRGDFTDDGWFKIGDQGYYEEDELVYIVGRYKEVMMFENNVLYFPNEIEAIITEHPAIEGACVVKVAEVRKDFPYDIARAYVTLKSGFLLEEKELMEFIHERSPSIILGGGIKFLEKFPRLANGKVDKIGLQSCALHTA